MKHSKSRNPAVTHHTRRSTRSPATKATTVTGEFAHATQQGSTGSFVSRFDKLRQFPVFPQAAEVDAATTALVFVPLHPTPTSTVDMAFMKGKKVVMAPGRSESADSLSGYRPTITVCRADEGEYRPDYILADPSDMANAKHKYVVIGPADKANVGVQYVLPWIALSSREESAARTALGRIPELLRSLDRERVDDIIKASIAAAIPLQRGARGQAELLAKRISEVLASVPMLTAAEVGRNAGTTSDKPEALAAQWSNRKQVFTVELAGHGIRFPSFQFQPDSGKPWPALAKVLPTLLTAFQPIDLLIWFVSPHPALDQLTPDSILHDAERLQSAADATLKPVDFW